jgi:hypothetical protein
MIKKIPMHMEHRCLIELLNCFLEDILIVNLPLPTNGCVQVTLSEDLSHQEKKEFLCAGKRDEALAFKR